MMIDTGMRVPPRGRGMVSSHGPGSGAPDTARRGPRMLNSSGGNTPGNLPFDTMPKDRPGMISLANQPGGLNYSQSGGGNQVPQNRMKGGIVDPNFRNMMAFKNSGGMGNQFNQSHNAQYGPGVFGVNPGLYYQHFDQSGMPKVQQPEQQQNPMGGMWGNLFSRMGMNMNPYGMGMMNPYGGMGQGMMSGMMGGMGGINTGPSPMAMRQFNLPYGGMMGGYNTGINGGSFY